MEFPNIKENVIEGQPGLRVKKEGNKTLNNNAELVWREIYSGAENTIVKTLNYHTIFICQFENIDRYPFDIETCSIEIIYRGPSPNLVALQPKRYKCS